MKSTYLILPVLLMCSACVMKQKIMDVPMVSMTHPNLPENHRLRQTGPVTGHFCADSMNDKGSIGLFDEAIKAAQNESHVDFISGASFYNEGSCITLEGTGEQLVDETAAAQPKSIR